MWPSNPPSRAFKCKRSLCLALLPRHPQAESVQCLPKHVSSARPETEAGAPTAAELQDLARRREAAGEPALTVAQVRLSGQAGWLQWWCH